MIARIALQKEVVTGLHLVWLKLMLPLSPLPQPGLPGQGRSFLKVVTELFDCD